MVVFMDTAEEAINQLCKLTADISQVRDHLYDAGFVDSAAALLIAAEGCEEALLRVVETGPGVCDQAQQDTLVLGQDPPVGPQQ